MLAFLQQNLATIVISLGLTGLVALAIRQMVRQKKSGGCAGCPEGKACPHHECNPPSTR